MALRAAVLAALLAASGASARLLTAASRRSAGAPTQEAFDDLTSCKVAYTRLADACNADVGMPGDRLDASPLPPSHPHSLVHDADGNTIRNTATIKDLDSDEQLLYKAPDSNGQPSASKGWDYLHHGDDWEHLGECGKLYDQSPIDLPRFVGVQGQTKSVLWFDYYLDPSLNPETKAEVLNDGHGLRYQVNPNRVDLGFLKIGKTEYMASEWVFHGPSEHSLDGAVFPLELQIYNRPKSGSGVVAISMFFKEGPSNSFLGALRSAMGDEAPKWTVRRGPGVGIVNGTFEKAFDLESLLPKGNAAGERTFINYPGSLTQPPCTTGVDWWVLTKPLDASREEIRFIRRSIFAARSSRHGNSRAAMPIGNRSLSVGIVGFQHALKQHMDYPPWKDHDAVKEPRGYNSKDTPWGSHWKAGDTEEPPTL